MSQKLEILLKKRWFLVSLYFLFLAILVVIGYFRTPGLNKNILALAIHLVLVAVGFPSGYLLLLNPSSSPIDGYVIILVNLIIFYSYFFFAIFFAPKYSKYYSWFLMGLFLMILVNFIGCARDIDFSFSW